MRVLMIAVNDPAGTAVQMCRAVNRLEGEATARLVTLETRYTHSWQKDLHLPDLDAPGLEEVGDLLRGADVLHFHMTADEHLAVGPWLPADHLHGKAVVHHHHGHPDFRGNPQRYRRKYRELGRTNLLVSTPDLLHLLPEARWQPNLVPIEDELYTPDVRSWYGPLKISHSPTRKDLKNTDDLLAVTQDLNTLGRELELDLIDDVPNAECLRRKRLSHVCFDHMQGYYGVSSLEALSQGVAAIAGLDEWNRRHMEEFAGTEDLPWVVAHDRSSLREQLIRLDQDRELLGVIGDSGRRFMEDHWSDRKLALRLVDFWKAALERDA